MRKPTDFLRFLVAVLLTAASLTARAQLSIEITGAGANRYPVAIATFKALIGTDVRPDLARIDRPTLILHGDKDMSAFLDITGRRVAAGIKGSELKVYPGAPHGLFVTHVEQVNRDLEAFFRA